MAGGTSSDFLRRLRHKDANTRAQLGSKNPKLSSRVPSMASKDYNMWMRQEQQQQHQHRGCGPLSRFFGNTRQDGFFEK